LAEELVEGQQERKEGNQESLVHWKPPGKIASKRKLSRASKGQGED
jgi:hypothetical protein